MPDPRPVLVPEDRYRRPTRGPQHLQRAAWATVRAALETTPGDPRSGAAVAARLWPDDPIPGAILRAAVSGARTDVAGWASELVGHGVGDFISGLAPQSAMATVIARGTLIPIGENTQITIPYRTPTLAGGWVGEGAPIPAAQLPLAPVTLSAKKWGVLVTFSRELAQNGGAEAIFTAMLRQTAGLVVDSVYLSQAAGTADSLAGLLNGVTALASTGSALGDLGLLAGAVAGTAGSGEVVYIASPGVAAQLSQRADNTATVLPSAAVPATRLVALDPAGIIHGINPVPDISGSIDAVLHLSDTPLQIASGAQGSGVLASPTQSMFQTATLALRLITDLSFVKLRPTAAAFIDPINWTA